MTETLTKPRIDNGTGTTPPMIHWVDTKRPGGYAICGKKLTEIGIDVREADCVVCEQMKRGS